MWIYNLDSLRFLVVNDAAIERYGYGREAFLAMRITDIRPFEDLAALRASLTHREEELARSGPWRHVTAGGETFWVDIASRLVEWRGRKVALVIASELSTDRALLTESTTLPVLSSVQAFARVVAERLAHAQAVDAIAAVVAVEFGDGRQSSEWAELAVLRAGLERVVSNCTATDTLGVVSDSRVAVACVAARADAVLEQARRLADDLRRQPLDVGAGGAFECRPSVGIRMVAPEDPHRDATKVVREAQLALAEALQTRSHTPVIFERHLRQRIEEEVTREQAILQALRTDAFTAYYQPVVNLASRRLHGYEALLRWPRPGGRVDGPIDVIAVAERTGAISTLGRTVRALAVSNCAETLTINEGLLLSMNVSALELGARALLAEVERYSTEFGIRPGQLCLELTESALVSTSNDLQAFDELKALRQMEVKIAIDDFGTGYSALSYLRHLPVDLVKIDRSFVADLATSEADTVLVEAITRLAHALGMTVVAEGVETECELAVLQGVGVDLGQGFLFGAPAPLVDVPRRFASS